jgi:acyl-coenzyme A thioesterase PaaI-like protein
VTQDWVVSQQRAPRGAIDRAALALSGLEMMRRYRDGELAAPPIAHLVGLAVTRVELGAVTAEMPVSPWLQWSRGLIPAAVLALFADTPLGSASQTVLAAGSIMTTAQMALTFHREVTPLDGCLFAEGWVGEEMPRNALRSHAMIRDSNGGLIAECNSLTTARTLPEQDPSDSADSGGAVLEPLCDTSDPYMRPTQGEVLPPDLLASLRGVDLIDGVASGMLPAPPLQRLVGLRPVSAHEGTTTWRMPASPWLCSLVAGELYGGATAMLAGMAALGTGETLVPAGAAAELQHLTVRFRSRAVPSAADLVAHGVVVRREGHLATVRARVIDGGGAVVATALAGLRV